MKFMKFILVLLCVLQLNVLIQSQSDYGAPSGDGSGQPSYPVISQTSDGGYTSQYNDASATSQAAGQTSQASVLPYYTSSTTATIQSPTSTHTHNSATPTAYPTTSGNGATNLSDSGSSNGSNNDNVGAIAGGVVGGVVGLALIGGLLVWLNRRGGCAGRSKRRRHDTTFDDFAFHTDTSGHNNDNAGGGGDGGGDDDSSPFQRRMVPMAQNSYMNLGSNGSDEYSETTTAVPASGYPPKATLHDSFNKQHPSDSYYGHADNQHLDPWQLYGDSATSPQTPNTYDRRVKPDTVDYKPHQI